MTQDFKRYTFEEVAEMIAGGPGSSGFVLSKKVSEFLENPEGEYTVYWPRDSIRLYESGSFEMAVFFAALMRDERTKWYSTPAPKYGVPEIAQVRRELDETRASLETVNRGRIYKRDRLLMHDVRFDNGSLDFHPRGSGALERRLDSSTIPLA